MTINQLIAKLKRYSNAGYGNVELNEKQDVFLYFRLPLITESGEYEAEVSEIFVID